MVERRVNRAAKFAKEIIKESQEPILASLERLADQCEEQYGKNKLVTINEMTTTIRLFVKTWREQNDVKQS